MNLKNETIKKEEIPDTFAKYFNEKVEHLARTCNTDENV